MQSIQAGIGYKIWGVDDVVYGPVDLPTLMEWVRDERVRGETWIFNEVNDLWLKAGQLPELHEFFPETDPENAGGFFTTDPSNRGVELKPGSLRRVKILADFTDDQLRRFVKFMEAVNVRQWQEVVKQDEAGEAMYLVLEGELRVRMMISGKETILTTLGPGEFFGEMALFDSGPRSADVVSNKDSMLLKVSAGSFSRLSMHAPDLAAPFLFSIGKTLTARIRADNKRYKDQINWSRTAQAAGR